MLIADSFGILRSTIFCKFRFYLIGFCSVNRYAVSRNFERFAKKKKITFNTDRLAISGTWSLICFAISQTCSSCKCSFLLKRSFVIQNNNFSYCTLKLKWIIIMIFVKEKYRFIYRTILYSVHCLLTELQHTKLK